MTGVVNLNAWLAERGWLTYANLSVRRRELPRYTLYKLVEQRRRALPAGMLRFAKQRAPRLLAIASTSQGVRRHRLSQDAGICLREDGQRRHQPPGARDAWHSRAGGGVRQCLRGDPGAGARRRGPRVGRAPPRGRASPRGTVPRANLEPIRDLIFEFAGYAWAGKGNLMKRTPTIWDTVKMAGEGQRVVCRHAPPRGDRRIHRTIGGGAAHCDGEHRRHRPDDPLFARDACP